MGSKGFTTVNNVLIGDLYFTAQEVHTDPRARACRQFTA